MKTTTLKKLKSGRMLRLFSYETESDGNYRYQILRAYRERRRKDLSYSLVVFAKHLGVNAGMLNAVLSEKRHLSPKMARRVANKLGLSSEETNQMLSEIKPAIDRFGRTTL